MNTLNAQTKGTMFEYYVRDIYHKVYNYVYKVDEDLPVNVAKRYNMKFYKNSDVVYDEGIDLFILDDNQNITHAIQCKVRVDGYLNINELRTFFNQCRRYNCEKILAINSSCKINKCKLPDGLKLLVIDNNDLDNYIINKNTDKSINDYRLELINAHNSDYNILVNNEDNDSNTDLINSENIEPTNSEGIEELQIHPISPDPPEFVFTINNNLYTYNELNEVILVKSTQHPISQFSQSKREQPRVSKSFVNLSEQLKPRQSQSVIKYKSFRSIQNEIFKDICHDPFKNWEINAACGIGKTITFKRIITHLLHVNQFDHVLILVPQISLAQQTVNVFNSLQEYEDDNIMLPSLPTNHLYTNNNHLDDSAQITICVYNSFNKFVENKSINLKRLLVVIDEAHHIKNKTVNANLLQKNDSSDTETTTLSAKYIAAIVSFISQYNLTHYSFSATLARSEPFNSYRINYPMFKGIQDNILVNYELVKLNEPPIVTSLEETRGRRLNQLVVDVLPHHEYKHILVYVNNVNFAIYLTKILNQYSAIRYHEHKLKDESRREYENRYKLLSKYPEFDSRSEFIVAEDSERTRTEIFRKFEKGEIRIIVSVNCIAEGIDLPYADTVIFFDDRKSDVSIVQCCGRALRKYHYPESNEDKQQGYIITFTKETEVSHVYQVLNDCGNDFIKTVLNDDHSKVVPSVCDNINYKFIENCDRIRVEILESLTEDDYIEFLEEYSPHGVPDIDQIIEVSKTLNGKQYRFRLNIGYIFDLYIKEKPLFIKELFNLTELEMRYLIDYFIDSNDEDERNRLKQTFEKSITKSSYDQMKSIIVINRVRFKKSELKPRGRTVITTRNLMDRYHNMFKRRFRRNNDFTELIVIDGTCYEM